MSTVRAELRQAGHPWHSQVDEAFGQYRLTEVDGYRNFLRAHARVLFALEPALEAAGIENLLPDWPQRTRRVALQADLLAMGAAVVEDIPVAPVSDEGFLWGCAYVLEGSRLGSRVLADTISKACWEGRTPPLAYLRHGEGQPLWPDFLKCLESAGQRLGTRPMLPGVEATFGAFLAAAETAAPTPS